MNTLGFHRAIPVLALTLLLAACGGGGNPTSEPPEAPVLNTTPVAVKTLRFSWMDVSGETEYRLLENPDGSSGFTSIAELPANETEYDLYTFLPEKINARYLIEACNNSGCSRSDEQSVETDGLATAIGYFKASNTGKLDQFGRSVALSADGSTLAVGALGEDSSSGINGPDNDDAVDSGAVYVFVRNDESSWQQQAYIKAHNSDSLDLFGAAIALSADGNTLVVGAPGESGSSAGVDGTDNNDAPESGAVYVFVRDDSGQWRQQTYIKASNPDAGDWFGYALALSADGNTLAVGAVYEDSNATGISQISNSLEQTNNDSENSGAVYLFQRIGELWGQQVYIKASNTGGVDRFGFSLALSANGKTLAVAAPSESSDSSGINGDENNDRLVWSGAVYLFDLVSFAQVAYIKASSSVAFQRFGWSVSLSSDGKSLAVGAAYEGDIPADQYGAAYLFEHNGTEWQQTAKLEAISPDRGKLFGWRVALSSDGTRLAVSIPYDDSAGTGLSGNPYNDSLSNSGAVRIYQRNSSGWARGAYLKAPNPGEGDLFGDSLAWAATGDTLAVGARYESSKATGIGGDQDNDSIGNSGAVYLY